MDGDGIVTAMFTGGVRVQAQAGDAVVAMATAMSIESPDK